jgi:hypothetical protein
LAVPEHLLKTSRNPSLQEGHLPSLTLTYFASCSPAAMWAPKGHSSWIGELEAKVLTVHVGRLAWEVQVGEVGSRKGALGSQLEGEPPHRSLNSLCPLPGGIPGNGCRMQTVIKRKRTWTGLLGLSEASRPSLSCPGCWVYCPDLSEASLTQAAQPVGRFAMPEPGWGGVSSTQTKSWFPLGPQAGEALVGKHVGGHCGHVSAALPPACPLSLFPFYLIPATLSGQVQQGGKEKKLL